MRLKLKNLSLIIAGVMVSINAIGQSSNFENEINKIAQKHEAVGLAVVVVKDGKPVYDHAIGFKDLEQKQPLTTDNLFRIASISKSFSSTAIMQLIEQGKLSLDDDFSDLVGFK
ncbi:MAG: serine hydrolase domain-containing protein, partial [Sphingobacterium sp.]